METRPSGPVALLASLALVVAGALGALHAAAQDTPTVKQKALDPVPSVQGRYNYVAYCASCHGPDGKGQGPAAPALKVMVPDLTTIARRAGKFDAIAVERIIAGDDRMPPAHGSLDMPVWGPMFRNTVGNASATLRLRNLVSYLKSIQAPAT